MRKIINTSLLNILRNWISGLSKEIKKSRKEIALGKGKILKSFKDLD